MQRLPLLLFLFFLGFPGYGQLHPCCPGQSPLSHDYRNPLDEKYLSSYDVKAYELDLLVSNTSTYISGTACITVEVLRPVDTLVLELQDALEVHQIRMEEQDLLFEHREQALYMDLGSSIPAGELVQLCIEYSGEAGQDRGFFAGISNKRDPDYGFHITYTLSEPLNALDWFPVKQVLEDKIDSVLFHLTCSKDLLAASNGVLTGIEEEDELHTLSWKTTYPMAYYLLSFTVGDYRELNFMAPLSQAGDSVWVQNFIYNDQQVESDWTEQIRMTAPLIHTYSLLLSDYPFAREKYGHAMAPMGGGMEHQTMTTIQDFDFFLVAHELAHQWFGDHITCGNWQDIWINEGFASYMEYVAAQHILGQDQADAWMDQAMSIALEERSGSIYVPEDEVEDEYRLFDYGLSYKKGAILLHMIRFILDDDALFFSTLQTYLERYGGANASAEDFREVLEESSGKDFSVFFQQWYYGEGYPQFSIQWEQEKDSLHIYSLQEATLPGSTPFFQLPFEIELRYLDGRTQRFRLQQDRPEQLYSLPVQGSITDLRFDPDRHLLKSVSVLRTLPAGKPYLLGPNPLTRELYVQVSQGSDIAKLRILTFWGQEVWRQEQLSAPLTLDLAFLAAGAYVIEMEVCGELYRETLVKFDTP